MANISLSWIFVGRNPLLNIEIELSFTFYKNKKRDAK